MAAKRQIPTPYLVAGGAVVALGILASPLRRVLFSVPVMTALVGAVLGRKEGKTEGKEETAVQPAPAPAPKPARRAKKAA